MDSPKRSPSSISTPTDENDDRCHEEMSVSKKSAMPQNKQYASPANSTGSKASPSRRKILAERNELLDSNFQRRSKLDSPVVDDEKIGFGEEGFSESSYDPVTNFLSPRPRFLRYKPNRRLEILSQADNCAKEDGETGSDSGGESSWSQEDDVSHEIEDEFEEVEEKGCGLKGLMKFLLCSIVLVLSTAYISSMNSQTPSPVVQAVSSCKNGYHMIQDHTYKLLKNFDGVKYFSVQREVLELVPTDDVRIQQELVTEIAGKNIDDLSEEVDLQREEEDVVDMIEYEGNIALENLGEREEEIEVLEFLEDEDYPEVSISELDNGDSEVTEELEALITIPSGENTTSSAPDGTSETENEVVSELSKEEKVDKAMFANGSFSNEVEPSSKVQIIDSMKTLSFLMIAIGGFLLSVLIALYRQKKRNGRHGISQTVELEPTFKQVQEENNCSLVPAKEVDAKLENSESPDSSKSFSDSLERDFDDVYHSRAPSIQLLGEFSVQELSTSRRSYGMRDRINESKGSSRSASAENVKNTKVHSSPLHVHSIVSEISSMETPYQKHTVTSEAYAEGGESRKPVTTTPLRRSSRIRDRSIKSP